MKTTFKIDFEGDIYELKGNNWGKEVLYRNDQALMTKINWRSKNTYTILCPKRGTIQLSFAMDTSAKVVRVIISQEGTVLSAYEESIAHLIPEWVKKVDTLGENTQETKPKSTKKKVAYGLVSLLVALFIWGWLFSWTFALVLVVVLFIHELGHFLAMAAFGYQRKGILFAPPFGAVAYGVKTPEITRERVIILLAGPLPGIVLGFMLFFYGELWLASDLTEPLGFTFVFINMFNLFPVSPLDGGRIVELVFLQKYPKAQLMLAGLGLIGLGVYAIVVQSILGSIFTAIFGLVLYGRVIEFKDPSQKSEVIPPLSLRDKVVFGSVYVGLIILSGWFFFNLGGF